MNDLTQRCIRAIYGHKRVIVLFTVLIAVIAVAKELMCPASYSADTLLVVTGLNAQGETAQVVPEPFSPKIYEQLVSSSAVLGEVLTRLTEHGCWTDTEPPELIDFMTTLDVVIETIDETTRPVSYSPLIRLRAKAETAEMARLIVDTWALTAIDRAGAALKLRLAGAAETLEKQQPEYEQKLDAIWQTIEKEEAEWNIEVLRKEMDARVELLTKSYAERTTIERDLFKAQENLRMIQEDLLKTVSDEEARYKGELDRLWKELVTEKSAWNTAILGKEIDARGELLTSLLLEKTSSQRELFSAHERLRMHQEDLVQMVSGEEQSYIQELDRLDQALSAEKAEWNIDVLQLEMTAQMKLIEDASGRKLTIEQELAGGRQRLAAVTEGLKGEEPFIELGRAPSEAAYWIVKGEQSAPDSKPSWEDLGDKVMVSQELNPVYWTLKEEEQTIQSNIAGRAAELTAIETQIAEAKTKQKEIEAILAEHRMTQDGLSRDIQLMEQKYTRVATEETLRLKATERDLVLEIATKTSTIQSIYEQIDAVRAEQDQISAVLADHSIAQESLQLDIEINRSSYDSIATVEMLKLKSQERETMLEIATKTASLKSLDEQIEQIRVEQKQLAATIAEHDMKQNRLKSQETIAQAVYTDVAKMDSFVRAAAGLARGEAEEGERTVGLNRIVSETYAIEDHGMLGKKGRVIAATALAFSLGVLLVLLKNVALPLLTETLERKPAAKKK
ncbi:MAG: hypothetical protein QG656_186 [Candidatus Hydrogenedentes bacterium]|nr:hypothetical protein [Candidatus Hydrogenedentota bacterium]